MAGAKKAGTENRSRPVGKGAACLRTPRASALPFDFVDVDVPVAPEVGVAMRGGRCQHGPVPVDSGCQQPLRFRTLGLPWKLTIHGMRRMRLGSFSKNRSNEWGGMVSIQQFGGDWTTEKLERLRQYLSAYTRILSKQSFSFAYIDAFAGTGYRELKEAGNPANLLLPELTEPESEKFLEGSAGIALSCNPAFHRYIFIEKSAKKLVELQIKLQQDFPDKAKSIIFSRGDANTVIQELEGSRRVAGDVVVLLT